MGATLNLTDSERVTIREDRPELLEVEAVYGPAGKPPPKHLHPAQDEHFEVLAGELRVRAGDEERRLRAGETIDIPRGTPHQMWNAAEEPARVTWQTRPGGRTREWFQALDRLHREGRSGPVALAGLLTQYRDVFRLAVGPDPLVRGALAGLAGLGRLTGR